MGWIILCVVVDIIEVFDDLLAILEANGRIGLDHQLQEADEPERDGWGDIFFNL